MTFLNCFQMLTIISLIMVIKSFPDGAPADTCVKKRPNQPNHGQARSQPLEKNPYEVVASSETFHPGQEVTVVIYPHGKQELFRGFFLQARDANSNEWIGEWQQSENTNAIPECSAITHGDNRDKLAAKLIWKAPQNKQGRVYFTDSFEKLWHILERYNRQSPKTPMMDTKQIGRVYNVVLN